ncbi:MAG: DUF5684 domain-containing protein [Actinomycetes bacterium]
MLLAVGLIAVYFAVLVFSIVVDWLIFRKASQPGWASIIPFYNLYIMLKIVGRPWWWILLSFLPFVGFAIGVIVCVDLGMSFARSTPFIFGMIFLPFIFYPILAFGSARYVGIPSR